MPYLVTESVGVILPHPHRYRWTDPPEVLAQQAIYHAQVHDAAQSDPRYAGLLAWAAFDYSSPFGTHPQQIKWAGVADGFRVAKPGAAIYLSQIDPEDPAGRGTGVLLGAGHERAPDGPGPNALLASNCEQVHVFVGGTHWGTGGPVAGLRSVRPPALPADPARSDRVPRRPPRTADRRVRGRQAVSVVRMSSNPAGDRLAMTVDDPVIYDDGWDATRVVFRAVDAYGNQRRFGSGDVRLRVTGRPT